MAYVPLSIFLQMVKWLGVYHKWLTGTSEFYFTWSLIPDFYWCDKTCKGLWTPPTKIPPKSGDPLVLELFNSASTGGKKHENTNLLQKLIIEHNYQ